MTLRELEQDAVLLGRRWLRDLFLADWGLKLIALLITLGLWFAVTGQRAPATLRLRRVPLFITPSGDMEISNDPIREVDLTVRGSKRALDAIRAGTVTVNFDATNFKPGERLVRLTPRGVTLELPDEINPESVVIERIEPNSVPLRLERSIEREVEVEVPTTGQLADGYELLGAQSFPARVRVRGPESLVNKLDKVMAETVALDGRDSSFAAPQLAIDIPDQRILPVDAAVDVQIKIDEQQAEKRLPGVAVRRASAAGDEGNFTSLPATVAVTLRGARSLVDKLQAADVAVVLDRGADGALTPRLLLPPEMQGRVKLLSTNPATFSLGR